MSLKNVALDPFLLAQLYTSPLVPSEDYMNVKESSTVPFLGGNKQNIVILIHNKEHSWLPDGLFTFLSKVLQACHFSLEEVALVNVASLPQLTLLEIKKELSPKKMILFGDFFKGWSGQELEKNKRQTLADLPCLFSDDLEQLHTDQQLKKEFWQALQAFFQLKR